MKVSLELCIYVNGSTSMCGSIIKMTDNCCLSTTCINLHWQELKVHFSESKVQLCETPNSKLFMDVPPLLTVVEVYFQIKIITVRLNRGI